MATADPAPIYLDTNATTPIHPEVAEAMVPFLHQGWGNPSSGHPEGRRAKAALDEARADVAALLGAEPDEIVFTSGGSEANNHAIKGAVYARPGPRRNVVLSAIEHPAVVEPCRFLERQGLVELAVTPVDGEGRARLDAIADAVNSRTVVVTVMHSNNETGALQPITRIVRVARAVGALMHTDAAQSVGKVPIDVKALGVDLLTVVGHKLYAPKGVGALFVKRGVELEPLVHGAGQERGRRAGTENVLLAVGLGRAARVAMRDLAETGAKMKALRDRLEAALVAALGDRVVRNGPAEKRLPNTLNVCIAGVVGADVLAEARGVAASTGSACHEGTVKLSPVLAAMGVSPELGRGALRLTVGKTTTEGEIDEAVRAMLAAVKTLEARTRDAQPRTP